MKALSAAAVSTGCGLDLTALSLLHRGRDWVHASEWDPSVPLHQSTYVTTATWGWPLAFVRDDPFGDRPGRIDTHDRLVEGSLVGDWLAFTAASSVAVAVFANRPQVRKT